MTTSGNRERFPAETYGPVFDAVQLGRGNYTTRYDMPWMARTAIPVPPSISRVERPGAPMPEPIPPALLSVILGRGLRSLTGQ